MAALYPSDTDYFFYALDGSTHKFFETYMDQQDFLNGTAADQDDGEENEEEPYYQAPLEEDGEETEDE
jgi:hypothetical protein